MSDVTQIENDNTPDSGHQLARPGEVMPNIIHLLPVTSRPFFPGQAVPLLMDARHWTPTMRAVESRLTRIAPPNAASFSSKMHASMVGELLSR